MAMEKSRSLTAEKSCQISRGSPNGKVNRDGKGLISYAFFALTSER